MNKPSCHLRIFETLSRRRKPAPHPIAPDYRQAWDVVDTRTGLKQKQQLSQSENVIFVDSSRDILPESKEVAAATDWGSEFSDSDTDASHPSKAVVPKNCDTQGLESPSSSLNEIFRQHQSDTGGRPHRQIRPTSGPPTASQNLFTNEDIYEQPDFESDGKFYCHTKCVRLRRFWVCLTDTESDWRQAGETKDIWQTSTEADRLAVSQINTQIDKHSLNARQTRRNTVRQKNRHLFKVTDELPDSPADRPPVRQTRTVTNIDSKSHIDRQRHTRINSLMDRGSEKIIPGRRTLNCQT